MRLNEKQIFGSLLPYDQHITMDWSIIIITFIGSPPFFYFGNKLENMFKRKYENN